MMPVSTLGFSKASKTRESKAFKMALIGAIPLSALILLIGAGCSTNDTGSALPITTTTQPYAMATLDSARIESRNGSINEVIIQQDGRIDLPSGSKMVRGMQLRDFHTLLLRSYPSAKEIKIVEFRPNRVTVLGEVFHQIHTELSDGPMRVMDAIAAANGFTPLANKRRVRLVRQNAGKVEVYEFDLRETMRGRHMEENILLQSGDVITVPRNFL